MPTNKCYLCECSLQGNPADRMNTSVCPDCASLIEVGKYHPAVLVASSINKLTRVLSEINEKLPAKRRMQP